MSSSSPHLNALLKLTAQRMLRMHAHYSYLFSLSHTSLVHPRILHYRSLTLVTPNAPEGVYYTIPNLPSPTALYHQPLYLDPDNNT